MTAVKIAVQKRSAQSYAEAMQIIGLPEREQQQALVDWICKPEGVIAVEAPTATGKSIGALIGAALHVKKHGGRAAVATYTNQLREQYISSEIPAARKAFPDIKFYSVAGASNYLCAQRIGDSLGRKDLPGWARDGLAHLQRQLLADPGHARLDSSIDDRLRRFARADTDACGDDRTCKGDKESGCGFRNARRAAAAADVVVTNHALLAINAQLEGLILGDFSVAVIDECHKLAEALRGQLTRYATGRALSDKADALKSQFQVALDIADELDGIVPLGGDKWENWPDEFDADKLRGLTKHAAVAVTRAVEELEADLKEHVRADEDSGFNPKCPTCTGLSREISRTEQLGRVIETVHLWTDVCGPSDELRHRIGTVELVGPDDRRRSRLALTPVTLDKAAQALVDSVNTLVFTSATVGTASDPLYSLTACGVADDVTDVVVLGHPLSYNLMDVLIDLRSDYRARLDSVISTYGGSALVLAGSHKRKKALAAQLEVISRGEVEIFTQPDADASADRTRIFEQFRDNVTSVLVGTASYYEGINAPGDTLRHVVIAELPRTFYTPLVQQLDANLRLQGDTFREVHQAPRIEMTLQQMMGRLIRVEGDYGRVTMLDDTAGRAWEHTRICNAASRFGSIPVHLQR